VTRREKGYWKFSDIGTQMQIWIYLIILFNSTFSTKIQEVFSRQRTNDATIKYRRSTPCESQNRLGHLRYHNSHPKLLPEPPHPHKKRQKFSLTSIVNTASSLERTRMVSVWMMTMILMMMMILIMPTGEDIYDGCGSDSIHHDTLL
jgi:hypothetical protein